MPSSKARQRRARENRQRVHNERQKVAPPPRLHNPYDAETVFLPRRSLGELRLHYKPRKAVSKRLKQKRPEMFKTIRHDPEKHTLIYGFDNAIIGYRIPAESVQENQKLTDAIQALSDDADLHASSQKSRSSNYRGQYISRHYCVWAAYSKQPFVSSEFEKDGVSAKDFMKRTQGLWDRMSCHFEVLFPSAYRDTVNHELPEGLMPLAGAFMGCVVNIQKDDVAVETDIHRDVRERPFVPSCLCAIGNFEGGNLILWELHTVVELKAGDLFFFYDSLIHHSNQEVSMGTRHSIVAFTQQNMWDYWRRKEGHDDKKMKGLQARQKEARERERSKNSKKKAKET